MTAHGGTEVGNRRHEWRRRGLRAWAAPLRRVLDNGVTIRRVPIEGTRSITVVAAFDAGARAERAEENGIAHFLEHLVFKGGRDYPTPRELNATADSIGARVDAWTSHDLVVFRVRSRAEVAARAIDLLTDFVGRPRLDPADLEPERGVVIQEIARAQDRPQDRADELIEHAAFGDHPLGRPVLGTEETLRGFDREDIVRFRGRRWSGEQGYAALVGNLSAVPSDNVLAEAFGRIPSVPPPGPHRAVPPAEGTLRVEEADTRQSHIRLLYRSSIRPGDRSDRAALTVLRTLLGGSPGSILVDEIREQRGLAYSVRADDHPFADGAWIMVSAGVAPGQCIEAYIAIRELIANLTTRSPEREHVERARAYAAGRRVLAFENTNVIADHLAETAIMFGEEGDPDREIATLDAVGYEDVVEVAAGLVPEPAIACVGPHAEAEFL